MHLTPLHRPRRLLATTLALLAALLTGCATSPPRATGPVAVKLLAINDFHGNLKPPPGGIRLPDPADPGKTVNVAAGGAEHLATAVAQLRARNPNHVFVAAGDLIGASPLLSALFHDEPTVLALNLMGLQLAAVGNHEFDRGPAELLRLQRGGCHPTDGCKGPALPDIAAGGGAGSSGNSFGGARFQYLAASTIDERSGRTLLPPYAIKQFEGVPVAFIGLTLKGTPDIVVPSGVAGLRFLDEADTVNALVPQLKAQGVNAIVVLLHEGGLPSGGINDCPGISGPIANIVPRLDKAVSVVVSGHTHRAYNCRIDGRLVTSADKYGTLVTEIDLVLDGPSGQVRQASANNLVVRTDQYAKDPAQTALISAYEREAAPLAQRVVGRLPGPLPREENPAGESPIGRLVADAQLAATRAAADGGAQLALMNPGGIRAALAPQADGTVRYEDLFSVQPFYNNLVTMTLTGAQLLQVLEQQWPAQGRPRILHASSGFSYAWDSRKPNGQHVVPGSVRLNGQPLDMAAGYRVTVNSFLASGGDGFAVLRQGRAARTGVMDVDALEAHIARGGAAVADAGERIKRVD